MLMGNALDSSRVLTATGSMRRFISGSLEGGRVLREAACPSLESGSARADQHESEIKRGRLMISGTPSSR